jgi:hypothetical protein
MSAYSSALFRTEIYALPRVLNRIVASEEVGVPTSRTLNTLIAEVHPVNKCNEFSMNKMFSLVQTVSKVLELSLLCCFISCIFSFERIVLLDFIHRPQFFETPDDG